MKHLSALIFFAFLLSTIGCKKDPIPTTTPDNYIIFGHAFGFCQGEQCVEIFKLDDKTISEDILDNYPNRARFYDGLFKALDNDKFILMHGIKEAFPMELLNAKDTVFGCPDCHDQGGMYLEYKYGKTRHFWIIDNDKSAVPVYLHEFMDVMRDKIELLQE